MNQNGKKIPMLITAAFTHKGSSLNSLIIDMTLILTPKIRVIIMKYNAKLRNVIWMVFWLIPSIVRPGNDHAVEQVALKRAPVQLVTKLIQIQL